MSRLLANPERHDLKRILTCYEQQWKYRYNKLYQNDMILVLDYSDSKSNIYYFGLKHIKTIFILSRLIGSRLATFGTRYSDPPPPPPRKFR